FSFFNELYFGNLSSIFPAYQCFIDSFTNFVNYYQLAKLWILTEEFYTGMVLPSINLMPCAAGASGSARPLVLHPRRASR
ncbi:hypothetical protein, partial [Adlercreutzia equolifaciens]|uniref:hypothetical protein n=1 Tax=Adlercreutzia equolifaciens TaxID=446660 RepID=UPI003AF0B748